jgi:response regulator RpfG family c-di-GMP phosphodiesterase
MSANVGHKAAECRRRAAEFKQMAENAWLPSNRNFLLEMAQQWLILARSYAVNEHMERTAERLDGLSAQMKPQRQQIDAQFRQLGILQKPERVDSRQLTGLRLIISN